MTSIYVLKLQNGKYYVGKSQDVQARFKAHVNGQGCEWTRLHPPISILEVRENQSPFMEDAITKEYMNKYGYENVRGGAYSQIELYQEDVDAIKREMRGASDRCLRCGRPGHWARDCFARTEVDGTPIEDGGGNFLNTAFAFAAPILVASASSLLKSPSIPQVNWKRTAVCYRCGKRGHIAPECWS